MQTAAVNAPYTLADALDPDWLTPALSGLTGGARITRVSAVEKFHTVATKQRFRVEWAGGSADLCLKAYLDAEGVRSSSPTRLLEHRFYRELAPRLDLRVPPCVATVIDEGQNHGITIMRDLVAAGARFGGALDTVTPDQVAQTLRQIALLHSRSELLDQLPWVPRTLSGLAAWNIQTPDNLQALLEDARGRNLRPGTRDARRLIAGLEALASQCEALPATLVHGDAHAGNSYWTDEGPGLIDWQLIQRGHWALDVAYHICAVLPLEVAAAEEFRLVDEYLDMARAQGCDVPDNETAHRQYRAAAIYGFYLWAVTTRVVRPVIDEFNDRLGRAVERHQSFALLGV